MNRIGIFSIIAVLLILCISLIQNHGENKPVDGSSVEINKPVALYFDTYKLYQEYRNNELRADENFKGRLIQLTGYISEIGKDFTNAPFITFSMGNYGNNNVRFYFKNTSGLSVLNRGDKITIEGICAGKIMDDVVLNDCSLTQTIIEQSNNLQVVNFHINRPYKNKNPFK